MVKRRTHLDILTLIAMLAMVICNISSDAWNSISFNSTSWNVYGWLTVSTQFGVPLLIALLGITVFNRDMLYSNYTVYRRLLPQAAISCGFWWLIVSLIYMKTNFANELDTETFMECMGQVLQSPYNIDLLQLIVMLFAFYPLLARIAQSRKMLFYAMLVSFAITMLVPIMENIPYVRRLNLFLNQINWGFFSVYGVYLFGGLWTEKSNFEWHHRVVIYCAGLLSTVAMFSLTKIFSVSVADVDSRFINLDSPFIAIQTFAIMVFAKNLIKREASSGCICRILKCVARNKYGFIALYVVGFELASHYIGERSTPLLAVFTYFFVNILCLGLRQVPLISYLLSDFEDVR